MAQGIRSACVNHPAVEATVRCKTCVKPICNACKEVGPTGVFCSVVCREKHEQFVERAAKLDQMQKRRRFGIRGIFRGVVRLVVLALVVLLAAAIATGLGFEVPVLTPKLLEWQDALGL
jgi:hypothetical protein